LVLPVWTGVEKDEQKAAKQGYANAKCNLGWCYISGTGVEKDEKKTVEWYQKRICSILVGGSKTRLLSIRSLIA